MKRLISPALIGMFFLASNVNAQDLNLQKEVEQLKAQMQELKKAQETMNITALRKEVNAVKAHDAHDNIKFNADLRSAYDYIDYNINGQPNETNGIWTNKFVLHMSAQAAKNLTFHGAIGVYKTFGYNPAEEYNGFQNMDWYANETPGGDANLRLKSAYFIYYGNAGKVPYTLSIGRRPAVDGLLANWREENFKPTSPISHNINMEFDGASIAAHFGDITGIPGFAVKICLGRGNSNVDAKYPTFDYFQGTMSGQTLMSQPYPYAQTSYDSANMDLAGFLISLYDDGQYKANFNIFKGWNMMGANLQRTSEGTVADNPANLNTYADDTFAMNLTDVGDMTGGVLSLESIGIGDGSSDFLFNTNAFVSFAWSRTEPKGTHGTFKAIVMKDAGMGNGTETEMLGSSKSQTGTSIYMGVNFPAPGIANSRFGLEYNHGSKYWRSFDYGEDTLIGSKLSARGNAYEAFYNFPIVGKKLMGQVRYTYIDYKYTGSDMFFGQTGTPMDVDSTPGAVKSASDFRLSVRYRY